LEDGTRLKQKSSISRAKTKTFAKSLYRASANWRRLAGPVPVAMAPPVVAPALKSMGVELSFGFHPHAGIGMVHPPVDLNLFMLPSMAAAPMGEAIWRILPLLVLVPVPGVIICIWQTRYGCMMRAWGGSFGQ
jgi:hypothetical protein